MSAVNEISSGHITGDGVNGLSRAFAVAGATSLLVSLWSIPEQESLEQLYQFHHSWREQGRSKAHALRHAQLASIQNYRDQPDVWAAFILTGD